MSDTPLSSYGSTFDLVPIQAMLPESRPGQGAIIVMHDGSFRMLIRSGSVNFDMRSPVERRGLTLAFGSLVNSLERDFPVQILSHSRMLDVDAYVHQFDGRLTNAQTPPAIKRLIQAHQRHFEQQVKRDNMLQREIFFVVPWKGSQGPLESSVADEVPGSVLIRKLSARFDADVENKPSDMDIATARQQLEIRSEQVIAGLDRIGVSSHRLNEDEIRNLLYSVYHPGLSERQRGPGSEDSSLGGFREHPSLPATATGDRA